MNFHHNPHLKAALVLAVCTVAMADSVRTISVVKLPATSTTTPAATTAPASTTSPTTTTASTVEKKHLIQIYGYQANSKTFMLDLNQYGNSWPFFEGRSVEFNGSLTFIKGYMSNAQFATDDSRISGFFAPGLSQNYVRILSSAQYVSGNPSATWNIWNDADRDAVVNNYRALARQARYVGFKGLFVDPEPYAMYGYNPWLYSDHSAPAWSKTSTGTWINAHTFADTQARMQDLGARVMTAVESEAPGTKILLAQGLGLLNDLCNGTSVDSVKWSNHKYGLYSSFIAGLASKVNKNRIVDMQENVGYWATSEADLKAGSSFLYDKGASLLLPADIIPIYRSYIHWGYMIYTDGLFRLTTSKGYLSGWMLASERPVFAATLTYWALKNASARGGADAEVMVYTEKPMWGSNWAGTTVSYPPSQTIPNAYATALNNIRKGLAPQDVTQIVADAWYRKAHNTWPAN